MLMKPLRTGEMNHDPTIVPRVFHCTPWVPRATRLNPMVEPTILCVPEIGSLKKVATNNQHALLAKAAKQPSINSTSWPSYRLTSRMPFLIVSDTLYPAK